MLTSLLPGVGRRDALKKMYKLNWALWRVVGRQYDWRPHSTLCCKNRITYSSLRLPAHSHNLFVSIKLLSNRSSHLLWRTAYTKTPRYRIVNVTSWVRLVKTHSPTCSILPSIDSWPSMVISDRFQEYSRSSAAFLRKKRSFYPLSIANRLFICGYLSIRDVDCCMCGC